MIGLGLISSQSVDTAPALTPLIDRSIDQTGDQANLQFILHRLGVSD
jgi:hypothetical protein